MKWIFRLITIGMLAGALAVPFFINNKQGKPMLQVPTKMSDLMPSGNKSAATDSSSTQTYYKWKDKDGVWHYGDTPPPNQAKFTTIDVNSNTNIIQSEKLEKPPANPGTDSKTEKTASKQKGKQEPDDSNPLSLERAMNIMNEAKQLQGQMDQRNQQMERYIEEAGK